MIRIKVRHELYSCDFEFERRLNIIKGDSGTGKSSLVRLLEDEDSEDKIECTLITRSNDNSLVERNIDLVEVTRSSWKDTFIARKDAVLIFDDLNVVATLEFARYYSKYAVDSNLYFLIISRDRLKFSYFKNLSYSINSIYRLVKDGKYHYLENYYSYGDSGTLDFDICITEDTKEGYIFFKSLFEGVLRVEPSTGGKSTIISDVERLSKSYSNILVILDSASFGCHIEEFYARFENLDINICYITEYECFEELLLRTNILNSIDEVTTCFSDLSSYANNEISWEKYFEYLICKVTKNKQYRYTHGMKKLHGCYIESCDICPDYRKNKCDWSSVGDKFVSLLEGTKYEYLLNLHNKEE